MVGTFPQAWQEVAYIVVNKLGGSPLLFAASTETVDISEPDYPGEGMPSVAGGRIWKQSPQEDGEITLEMYPTDLSEADNTGLFQYFNGGTVDASQPLATDTSWTASVDRARDKFMVVLLWTDDTTLDTAAEVLDPTGATGTNKVGLRFYAKECRITSHKSEFTDGILKMTVTFKFPAMNYAGTTKTHGWESSNDIGAVPLSALTYSSGI